LDWGCELFATSIKGEEKEEGREESLARRFQGKKGKKKREKGRERPGQESSWVFPPGKNTRVAGRTGPPSIPYLLINERGKKGEKKKGKGKRRGGGGKLGTLGRPVLLADCKTLVNRDSDLLSP